MSNLSVEQRESRLWKLFSIAMLVIGLIIGAVIDPQKFMPEKRKPPILINSRVLQGAELDAHLEQKAAREQAACACAEQQGADGPVSDEAVNNR